MSKKTLTLLILIILIALGGAFYWFFIRTGTQGTGSTNNSSQDNGIFSPFGTTGGSNSGKTSTSSANNMSNASTSASIPPLREISAMPVGGMVSSSTPSTTIIRWVDRGTGHVYEAYGDNVATVEISNTTIPMIYKSYWNSAANALIFQSLAEDSDTVTTFYTTLIPTTNGSSASTSSTTSQTGLTQYLLAGSPLSSNTLAVAVSPAFAKLGNQVFTLVGDGNGGGAGYISNFDGTKKTQIFDTPLTQLNIQWPATNTIALTTKGSALETGFLYFVNPKNGVFNEIIGSINGLSTLVNSDASEVLYSHTDSAGTGIITSVYSVGTGQSQDFPFDTLAEKCVWSNIVKSDLYCAIPSTVPAASYPDAWYQGTISFSDSIWEIDTDTGEVHELVDLLKTSGTTIDAENLQLSPKEDFLYFINKKDLSLWSFNLNAI